MDYVLSQLIMKCYLVGVLLVVCAACGVAYLKGMFR